MQPVVHQTLATLIASTQKVQVEQITQACTVLAVSSASAQVRVHSMYTRPCSKEHFSRDDAPTIPPVSSATSPTTSIVQRKILVQQRATSENKANCKTSSTCMHPHSMQDHARQCRSGGKPQSCVGGKCNAEFMLFDCLL